MLRSDVRVLLCACYFTYCRREPRCGSVSRELQRQQKKETRDCDVRHWSQFPRWRRWAGWGTEITSTLTAAETVTKVNLPPSTGAGLTGSRPWRCGVDSASLSLCFPWNSGVFVWDEVCFPLAESICFRWQPHGVLPTSTPAAVTFLPPRSVSSTAWRQSKNRAGRYSRVCGSSPPSCCASGSNPDTCRLRPPLSPAWRSCELPPFKPPIAPRRPALNFESVRGTAAGEPLS